MKKFKNNGVIAKGVLFIFLGLFFCLEISFAQQTDSTTSNCSGVIDNFNCPSKSTVRDTALVNLLTSKYPCTPFLNFDEIPGNIRCSSSTDTIKSEFFIHKFTFAPGRIISASLEFRAKASAFDDTKSDKILFFNGKDLLGACYLKDLPEAGGAWNNNQDATFTIDLGSITSGIITNNILQILEQGNLDIVVGERTGVDHMCLTIENRPSRFVDLHYRFEAMHPVLDTIRVYLANSASPFEIIDSSTVFSQSDNLKFRAIPGFTNVITGNSYYIIIKHRNSIETWSASPVLFDADTVSYDFTSSVNMAFGDNLILVNSSPDIYAIYSGDVNQDGTVDASDLSQTENSATISESGYVQSDVTGDDFVDAGDLSVVENNILRGVSVKTPFGMAARSAKLIGKVNTEKKAKSVITE